MVSSWDIIWCVYAVFLCPKILQMHMQYVWYSISAVSYDAAPSGIRRYSFFLAELSGAIQDYTINMLYRRSWAFPPPGIDFYIGKFCVLACFFTYVSSHTIYKYYQLYGIFINVFITKGLFQNGFYQKNYINIIFVETTM